jgi:hypothetical protein
MTSHKFLVAISWWFKLRKAKDAFFLVFCIIETRASMQPFTEDRELFKRPIELRFEHFINDNNNYNKNNNSLLVLDFGSFELDGNRKVVSDSASGKLWRVMIP